MSRFRSQVLQLVGDGRMSVDDAMALLGPTVLVSNRAISSRLRVQFAPRLVREQDPEIMPISLPTHFGGVSTSTLM